MLTTNNIIIQLPRNKLTTMLTNYKKLYTIQLSQQFMKSWLPILNTDRMVNHTMEYVHGNIIPFLNFVR